MSRPLLVRLLARSGTASRPPIPLRPPICNTICATRSTPVTARLLSSTACRRAAASHRVGETAASIPAEKLNHQITDEEREHFDRRVAQDTEKQIRAPWHREGSDTPPVARQRSASAMTKGKLLTTPSRMLKLILPLTTHDHNQDRKNVEPLALLVHPQQPLSYLERLIQAELPMTKVDGKERVPNVYFRAEDSMQDCLEPGKKGAVRDRDADKEEHDEDQEHTLSDDADETNIDGKVQKTGKLNRTTAAEAAELRGGPGKGGVESYSGLGHEAPSTGGEEKPRRFVRWSSSTEIGDFIRDAARGQEFAIEIESPRAAAAAPPTEIRVGVPSFHDRTFYLRMRLRKTSAKIAAMAAIKQECDRLAHKGAQRVAMGGFGLLCGWWYLVYRLTFETDLGWDVMEPVTYLVGLSTLIGGYVWFLYHNREVSYRSAMHVTVSRRQSTLYQARGFDPRAWQALVEEANALRREIKAVANEYDVEWDELEDERDAVVAEALRKERRKRKEGGSGEGKRGEGEGEDELD